MQNSLWVKPSLGNTTWTWFMWIHLVLQRSHSGENLQLEDTTRPFQRVNPCDQTHCYHSKTLFTGISTSSMCLPVTHSPDVTSRLQTATIRPWQLTNSMIDNAPVNNSRPKATLLKTTRRQHRGVPISGIAQEIGVFWNVINMSGQIQHPSQIERGSGLHKNRCTTGNDMVYQSLLTLECKNHNVTAQQNVEAA